VVLIEALYIPLPPLPEQERIVRLLDEAGTLRRLRAGADRRAAELLHGLFNEMFGDPVTNGKSWPVKQLREVSGIIVPTRDKPKRFVGSIPWVTLPDLKGLFIETSKNQLTQEDAREVGNRLMPANTVLLSCAGTLGKVAVASVELYANQQFYGLTPNPAVLESLFLAVSLQMKGKRFFARLAGTSTLGFFSKQRALEIEIVLPPLTLQKEFAKRVTEILALTNTQAAVCHRLDDLLQSLLHRSFQGEL
jgi:type I restriction enzyme S subunit